MTRPEHTPTHQEYDILKRGLDVCGGMLLLLVLAPVLIIVTLAVALDVGRPVIFRQARAGRCGRTFELWKFRTMRPAHPGQSDLDAVASDADRLTRLGRFLRASSLDELPQLMNVVRGEMSFVGPRPLLVEYLDRYTREQARRHEVRPGITGLAQVSGRNALSWDDRLALDIRYVDHRSIALDSRILLLTVWVALSRHGISSEGSATATPFKGSPSDSQEAE